jgi:hypothetical protein
VYLNLVNDPLACATNPGVDDIIWSTLTQSPGPLIRFCETILLGVSLDLHGFLVALPNLQAKQIGVSQTANLFGKIPDRAIPFILLNGRCPNFMCQYSNNSRVLSFTSFNRF